MRAAVIDTVLRRSAGTDDEAVFERARKVGFSGVEVALGADDRGRRAALRAAARATGLAIPSLVLGSHITDGGLADANPAVTRRAAEQVRAAIDLAVEVGADSILVPFFLRSEAVADDAVERLAKAFAQLCPAAASAGVTLLYEGTLPAREIVRIAERVDSPAFGCYFDLANPVVEGLDTATEIRVLGELVRRVHFKDTRARRGDCQPGLGRVDFEESARALAEIGYHGWLVLETPAAPHEVVARDLSFARTVFPALDGAPAWPRLGGFTHELGDAWQELGLETVQLSRDRLAEWLDQPETDPGGPVAAIGGYKNLIAADDDERRANVEFVARCLEHAPRLGTSVVSTHAGTRHPTEEWADFPENRGAEAWSLLIDALEYLLPVAERAGSILALEGSVKSVLRTVSQVVELLDRFAGPHLQLVADPYNYLSTDALPAQERLTRDFLDRFEHRFVVAHVKDVGPDGAEVSTPTVGTGVFAQRPYFKFLRTRRPDLPLILEHLTPAQVPDAIRFVRSA